MTRARFPILLQFDREVEQQLRELSCPRSVPWQLVEPAREQAKDNHDQSLEQLASRGGLSPVELVGALRGLRWGELKQLDEVTAARELIKRIEQHDDRLVVDRAELRLLKYASSYAELDADQLTALLSLLGEISVRANPEGEIVGGNIERGKAALAALVQFGRRPLTLEQVRKLMRDAAGAA